MFLVEQSVFYSTPAPAAFLTNFLVGCATVYLCKNCFGFRDPSKPGVGLLVGNHIVNASILMSYKSVCGVSYRLISTGQLHESLVLASTSGLSTQWSAGGLSHV